MDVLGVTSDLGTAVAKYGFRIPYRQHWARGHSGIDGKNVNNVPEFMQQSKKPSRRAATWEVPDNQGTVFILGRNIIGRMARANASQFLKKGTMGVEGNGGALAYILAGASNIWLYQKWIGPFLNFQNLAGTG